MKRVELGKQEIAIGVDLSTFLGADTVVRYAVPAKIRRRVEIRIVIEGARGPDARRPDSRQRAPFDWATEKTGGSALVVDLASRALRRWQVSRAASTISASSGEQDGMAD